MKKPRMRPMEVLAALRARVYTVCLTTGALTRTSTGRRVTPFTKKGGRRLVRVYVAGKVKAIHLARLVWMAGADRTIPKQFEVHHRDERNDSDGFANLICLHRLDHRKMHAATEVYAEDIPY